jgi:hypothetical protein
MLVGDIPVRNNTKMFSSPSSLVDLEFDSKRGIGFLRMKNAPVNSLSLEM